VITREMLKLVVPSNGDAGSRLDVPSFARNVIGGFTDDRRISHVQLRL
jgi:hypothetical protein